MNKKTVIISMGMMALLFSPLTTNAQYRENKYGIQPWFKTSLMGREYSNNSNNITNHDFGNPLGGVDVTNQTFSAPLGSGLFVLLMASASYSTLKSNKRNNKSKKENIK